MVTKELNIEMLENRRMELEEELNDVKAALRLLEKFGNNVKVDTDKKASKPLNFNVQGEIDINDLDVPQRKQSNKQTLQNKILEILPKFGDQEFTVNHIVALLNQLGVGSEAKHFKNRVSLTIKKLYELNKVDRVHKGIGSDPHGYKQKAK